MAYFYPLLLYTGLGGGLVLLGMASIPRLRILHKPVTAVWLTAMIFLWLLLPRQGRWLLSIWSPGAVLGGQIILDVTPASWWIGLVLALIFCGAAWIEVAERRETPLVTGPLLILNLLLSWLALSSGSLLTMLAMWAVFDLAWGIASLVSGADGNRVVFGLAIHGIASLILWVVSLFLLQQGTSELWWLMRPSEPMFVLLVFAASMRIGFYPFHIVAPAAMNVPRALNVVNLLGPISGVALLYRLLTLPGSPPLPAWWLVWGMLSLFWDALMAWGGRKQLSVLDAVHALLAGVVTGAGLVGAGDVLLRIVGLWAAGGALLIYARGRDTRAIGWMWPVWMVVLFFVGAPPSPVGALYWTMAEVLPVVLRAVLFVSIVLLGAVFISGVTKPARGSGTPPRPWQWMSLVVGLGAMLIALLVSVIPVDVVTFSWTGFGLWFMALIGAIPVIYWAGFLRERLRLVQPLMEFVDLQWLYHSVWRGGEHLLSVLRVAADVVEGSAALLWSLLILMLILLVVASR